MSHDQWVKVGALLEEALARPPGERAAFLQEACDDAAVSEEVASLLVLSDEASDYFDCLASAVPSAGGELEETRAPEAQTGVDPLGLEGMRAGRYTVEEPLGGGGMGVVYRARDTQLGRTVALKFLPPHLSAHRRAEARFVREAKAAAALDHPHIATVYEIGTTDAGRRFIAMAYYDGETLEEKLTREGSLPVEEAVGYAVQIAEALERAHEAGIVHRDVKPANVMVTGTGQVKLLDFGLAKAGETQSTKAGTVFGTAAYMSPEQARGEAVGARTDLWALGVVLYEMLTGERPYQGANSRAVIYSVLHDEAESAQTARKEVPDALAQIIDTLLRKDPSERYPSAGALLADLHTPGMLQGRSMRRAALSLRDNRQGLYHWIAGGSVVICLAVMVYAALQFHRLRQNVEHLEERAVEQFYENKEMELKIARYEQLLEEQAGSSGAAELEDLRRAHRQRTDQYEGYINELGIRRKLSSTDEQLIFRVAYIFNECELEIPASFVRAVRDEINNFWLQEPNKSRFIEAVQRAKENGYASYIAYSMERHNLPPHFFYLALQESSFRVDAVGPNIKWGVPKGLWQLVPSTARRYGLEVSQKPGSREANSDERHDFAKSTEATARYLRDLYTTLAQASGLLVIASYNWGESRVIHNMQLLQTDDLVEVPADPKSRSYWHFWQENRDRIPDETHDYVVRVFAAAVIGQNPRAFGINLDNPLEDYIQSKRNTG